MPSQAFTTAAESAKALPTKPSDQELLELYSLYKQATLGDCTTDCPKFYQLTEKAKWDAWTSKKGLSKEDAEQQYIALVKKLSQ